jgi:hypothetical protein
MFTARLAPPLTTVNQPKYQRDGIRKRCAALTAAGEIRELPRPND